MTLKEIAIKLLEKYEASENVAICEYSTNINKDMDLLEKEVKKYYRMIEMADRKTEPLKIELTVEDLQDWKDRMRAEAIVTEPQTSCKTCRFGEVGEGYVRCAYYSKATEQDEPQTEAWKEPFETMTDCHWK